MDNIPAVKHQLRLGTWAERIRNCQLSGMTVQNWCKANGINVKTYYYWLKRVREQTLNNLPPELASNIPAMQADNIPVHQEDKVSFKKLEVISPIPAMQAAVIIKLPYATVEVTNDATQRTVEAVLLALKSVC